MFEVLPINPHTPLVDCLVVKNMLMQTRPCNSRALLHMSNVEYGCALCISCMTPQIIVNWIQVGCMVATGLGQRCGHVSRNHKHAVLVHCPLKLVLD